MPPRRTAYLEEMVRLASADAPGVLCLQEVPVWALAHLGAWSGMTAVSEVAARPVLGPAEVGRALTSLNPGLLRSVVSGQANAILTRLEVLERRACALNPPRFRRREARLLGLGLSARLYWAKERRVCQAVRVRLPDGQTALVANLHATKDERLAAAEAVRAAAFADGLAQPDEPVLLCGDFNVRPELSAFGFPEAGPGVDHVLVRGLPAKAEVAWPEERRRVDGLLLSDHAPVEVRVG